MAFAIYVDGLAYHIGLATIGTRGSMYLHDSEGPSPANLVIPAQIGYVLMACAMPWILGGDFQCGAGRRRRHHVGRHARGPHARRAGRPRVGRAALLPAAPPEPPKAPTENPVGGEEEVPAFSFQHPDLNLQRRVPASGPLGAGGGGCWDPGPAC